MLMHNFAVRNKEYYGIFWSGQLDLVFVKLRIIKVLGKTSVIGLGSKKFLAPL